MMRELAQAFKRIRLEGKARAVILTGAGRAFCAGVDLTAAQSVFQGGVTDEETDVVVQMELITYPYPPFMSLSPAGSDSSAEHVSGGRDRRRDRRGGADEADLFFLDPLQDLTAAQSVFQGDVADEEADVVVQMERCTMPFSSAARMPNSLTRTASEAREVSLTADPVSADKAERWGLLSRVVEADQLMPTAIAIAKTVAANHQGMVLRYKAVINDGIGLTLSEGRQLETERARAYYKQMTPQDFENMKVFIASRSGKSKL
ncbi:unnamed protein product [Closterium sp. Naga37s-1]|nr:unnamed protein product [Closterium sp. Naga37s-1]